MRIVSLNIRAGGKNREDQLLDAFVRLSPDVAVLPEFHPGRTGDRLLAGLADLGLAHQVFSTSRVPRKPNAVAIASRGPISASRQPITSELNGHRVLEATIGPVVVSGVYFPLAKPKVAFWRDEFLPYARAAKADRRVIVGDLNSGLHRIDEARATLFASDSFAEMSTMGWTDAWRSINPDGREYTWYSPAGNGFRLDHAFLSPALAPALRSASYVHETRETKVSDHSALVVEVDI